MKRPISLYAHDTYGNAVDLFSLFSCKATVVCLFDALEKKAFVENLDVAFLCRNKIHSFFIFRVDL